MAAGSAAAQGVELRSTGAATISAAPGDAVTLPFRLVNRRSGAADVGHAVHAPSSLRTVLHGSARRLESGASELVLVSVRVATDAPAGRHMVRIVAAADSDAGTDSVGVDVAARRGLAAVLAAAPPVVIAGEPYTLRFQVRNTGNSTERVVVHAAGDRGVSPSPRSRMLTLAAGESANLEYSVDTRPLGHRNLRHQVVLRVAAADGDASTAAVARSLVELVPRGRASRRSGSRPGGFPVELRLRTAGSGGGVALEARGGILTRGSGIQFLARTADAIGAPFARQDEYHLRLSIPALELRLGDDRFGFSRIAGAARQGAGGSAVLRLGALRAGGFLFGDRRTRWSVHGFGAFVRAGADRAGVGVIGESGERGPRAPEYSAEAWLHPGRMLRADVEVGLGGARADGSPPRRVAVHGAASGFRYDLVHSRARMGVVGGTDLDAATVSVGTGRAIAVLGSLRRGVVTNPFRRWDEASSPVEHARVRLDLFRRVHAEVRAERRPLLGGLSTVRAVRLGFALPVGAVTLAPSGEWGESGPADGAAETTGYRMAEMRMDARVRGVGVSTRVRRERGWAGGLAADDGRWTAGLDAWLTPERGPRLRIGAAGVRPDSSGRLHGHVDLSVEQPLPLGHALSLRLLAQRAPGTSTSPMLQVEYRIPLVVPLGRARSEGLAVSVIDAGSGRGAAGAVVRVGGRSGITDRAGVAVLADVPMGHHAIRVERASLGPAWVTRSGESPGVDIGADRRARVRVEVTEAGSVSGRLLRERSATSAAGEPLGGVEVVLEGDGPPRLVTTAPDGSFRFEGLWPGWWRLRVVQSSLPRHHEASDASWNLMVRSRLEEVAIIRIVERARAVRIIDGGELRPEP